MESARELHEGWRCVDVVDFRGDGPLTRDAGDATCQMCGNKRRNIGKVPS